MALALHITDPGSIPGPQRIAECGSAPIHISKEKKLLLQEHISCVLVLNTHDPALIVSLDIQNILWSRSLDHLYVLTSSRPLPHSSETVCIKMQDSKYIL